MTKRDAEVSQVEGKIASGLPGSCGQAQKVSEIAQTSFSREGENHEKYSALVSAAIKNS
jgi:hypothetical protein